MASPFESVSPLPAEVRRSLIALVVIGSTSFVSTSLLFAHMTYTLLRWKIRDIRIQREELKEAEKPAPAQEVDLHLGLAEDHYYQTKRRTPGDSNETSYSSHPEAERSEIALDTRTDQGPGQDAISCRREKPPNPLLLLIYNLLLADITLSAAYIHDGIWLSMDGIIVPSPTCSSQGWIISLGCLTTSGFLLIISIFSYLGIIRGYKATSRDVMIACSTLWLLSVLFASFGSMFFHDQSYYGRETNWVSFSHLHLGYTHASTREPAVCAQAGASLTLSQCSAGSAKNTEYGDLSYTSGGSQQWPELVEYTESSFTNYGGKVARLDLCHNGGAATPPTMTTTRGSVRRLDPRATTLRSSSIHASTPLQAHHSSSGR